ncbi:YicC/YloC family endoribonuclease [Methylicorpusculum sp.]|uniref:YicC/YloC family endoribonuclease n=1 Tax=Methylicorpusculum sp. TaxID=2713644 RepID=UPI0027320CAA|nr:YicC/YloC family endoribonuclease [Methylicorpusculum sp.]MDP2180343.1 YicC/YloC family endoribonuclease [Methylicorpusculum sp.]MDP3528634.1 YicC/YloC family endoribonuclease [Methylicorpusculum sp.]
MTAFAGCEVEVNNLIISCELRSVNHRYCEMSFKLPERLRSLETDLRGVLSTGVKRGKVECALNCKKQTHSIQDLNIDMQAVEALLSVASKIEGKMQSARPFSALEVLVFPGIQQESEADVNQLKTEISELVHRALLELLTVREREGAQLSLMIEERCSRVKELISAVHQRMPQVLLNLREKINKRIAELVAEPDFERFEQEFVFVTQKLDVEEELDRLETHVTEVLRVLDQSEPVGRRLDFLMQEMNREANTLGSKSGDKEITNISIELKVLIEQMREQVQNIE